MEPRYPPAPKLTPRQRAANRMEGRLATLTHAAEGRCAIPGCTRDPGDKSKGGLSLTHCRYHLQYRSAHGSFWKGTYGKEHLRHYRLGAMAYLKAHRSDPAVVRALNGLEALMWRHREPRHVADWPMMTAEDKALSALARLRVAGIAPERLLVNHLAISAAVHEDPIGPGGEPDEYRLVQIAKACIRMASGQHWRHGGRVIQSRYPRSRGLVLRVFGKMVDRECSGVPDGSFGALLEAVHEVHRAGLRRRLGNMQGPIGE